MNKGPTSTRFAWFALCALGACAPSNGAPPPPPCSDPCSTGTPNFNTGGSRGDGGAADASSASDASAIEGGADAGVAVVGSVAEVRAIPRTRAENTALVENWTVRSLLDESLAPVSSSMTGTFTVGAAADSEGIVPLRASTNAPAQCAIGHRRVVGEEVAVLSLSAARIAEALAPTGITVDTARAHVVVEVENGVRARVRDVRVGRSPGGVVAVAYDNDSGFFAVSAGTGPQGTAIIPNLDAPATPAKILITVELAGRTRTIPAYVARGCTTFVSAVSP